MRSLEKRPDDRFQTVEEFAAALAQPTSFGLAENADLTSAYALRDLDVTEPPPSPSSRPKKRERSWMPFVVSMLVVSALGIGTFLLAHRVGTAPPPQSSGKTKPTPAGTFSRLTGTVPAPAPIQTVVPAGTDIAVSMKSAVNSALAVEGQVFSAIVDRPAHCKATPRYGLCML